MRKMLTNIIVVVWFASFSGGCSNNATEIADPLSRIERKVITHAKKDKIPSLQATITTANNSVSFSYTNPDVQPQVIYGIGSTTKLLAATLIFDFIEQGKLQLSDKVVDYVTDINHIEGFNNITIENLMNHTSGLSDYTKHSQWGTSVTQGNAPTTFQEKLSYTDATLTNYGTFNYSNTNYLMLQEVVTAITQQPFNAAFNTYYQNLELPITMGKPAYNLQAFYATSLDAVSDVSHFDEAYGYDGGAYTTSAVLNVFMQKLFVEKTLLNDDSLAKMQQWTNMNADAIPVGEGAISQYGNGIMQLKYDGKTYMGHFGGTLQYQSFLFYNQTDNVTISMVTNCSGSYYNNVFFQGMIPEILDKLQ